MTIPEAVGLVLMAGLGGHGDLCVLDMGEQIKIADLARNLITLSGNVPGEDIPIVYTGLRPGEKLYEELLTEEEEETRSVSNRIFVAQSPEPPQDLGVRLEELWRIADAGDADGLRKAFSVLVPTYQRALGTPPPRPRAIDAGADARPAAPAPGLAEPSLVGVPG
jgi:FlaA1/EpsC-like NDP-sugar epimerase